MTDTIPVRQACKRHGRYDPHGWCSYVPTHGDGSLRQRHETGRCPGEHEWCPGGKEMNLRLVGHVTAFDGVVWVQPFSESII